MDQAVIEADMTPVTAVMILTGVQTVGILIGAQTAGIQDTQTGIQTGNY